MGFDDLLVQRGTLEAGTVSRSVTGEDIIAWSTGRSGIPVLVRPFPMRPDQKVGLQDDVTHVIFSRVIPEVAANPLGHWRMLVEGREYVLIDPQDAAARGHHWETRARRLA